MDTNRIRYFLSLVKTGSVTKAAELHRISPPALSKSIKVLEAELNEKLVAPSGRGILLTDAARALAPKLEEILQKLDAVIEKSDIAESSSSQRPLRVATFEVFSTYFMENCLGNAFAGRACLLHELAPGQMEEAVASHVADFGLTYIPIPHAGLDHIRIQQIEMGLFGLKGKFQQISEKETPFVIPIAPVEGSPNKVRGLDGWPDDAFPRLVPFKVTMLETALGIARRGLAVVYAPKFIVRLHNEVSRAEFQLEEKQLPRKFPQRKEIVYLIKRKADLEGELAKKLAASVRKLCV